MPEPLYDVMVMYVDFTDSRRYFVENSIEIKKMLIAKSSERSKVKKDSHKDCRQKQQATASQHLRFQLPVAF